MGIKDFQRAAALFARPRVEPPLQYALHGAVREIGCTGQFLLGNQPRRPTGPDNW